VRSVVIHGHFYQPPREDPWLDEVETEPSAAPYHDWNERIERECYRAVVAARLAAPDRRIARIVNTLELISFDFGATLLEWLEREAPRTYGAVLEADRLSRSRCGGHGNAMAMPYHHIILPLASRRDKVTEVRWGIADFRRRFGRDPEGMWLPETAVDRETLEVLAEAGIAFTVVAPHQLRPVPAGGLPGVYRSPSGRTLAVFAYDAGISHDVAFGPLLGDSRLWHDRLVAKGTPHAGPHLLSVATDGETYGHHHRFGEMALAAVLDLLGRREDVLVENFASFLARHAPRVEVGLVEPSSWSCPHGVERWRADCGCRMAPNLPTDQKWRAPLRAAAEWLAGRVHEVFEREGGPLLGDCWAARDAYGSAQGTPGEAAAFAESRISSRYAESVRRARELLEMERQALRSFSSCAWFFDDLSGVEVLQAMRHAARAIELAGSGAPGLEEGFLERLEKARSSIGAGNGRQLYDRNVRRAAPRPAWVAAGAAAVGSVGAAAVEVAGFSVDVESLAAAGAGAERSSWRVSLSEARTGRGFTYQVEVEKTSPAELSVRVSLPGGGEAAEFHLADLPEPYRDATRAALRRSLAERWLSAAELVVAAAEGRTVVEVASRALIRAVGALERDGSREVLERIEALADLLELHGEPIPFDAQTEFSRVLAVVGPSRGSALGGLAWRLGFAGPAGTLPK
jgi:alpha-amylase/alpha-mannosidase (GH57 family)